MMYLLLTGEFPTKEEFDDLQNELRSHGSISEEDIKLVTSIPKETHPMTMLSLAILFLQRNSKFFDKYDKGMKKADYWSYYYDDMIGILAKVPQLAAIVYRHRYKEGKIIPADLSLDWAGNYSHMLGYDSLEMKECIRGYLTIHADHEGGNVSAHTSHLVGSALADPYLSLSAAVNGLAGPLHGLANQECLKWLIDLKVMC
jgi:citrate synthase